ncbi:MAG: FAD-dependent oxidoreductase [Bacteroidetes bacterium]|jgi:glycine/D-amino acid oxidase-like deaminating enzyme|nr:FAD-dependent oxidoreductase [Bacteroidota bacterium]
MFHQKRNNSITDFIIVGQGIAGSVVALTLIKSGYTVSIVDQPGLSSSSKIAGGIWNPVVFKRLTKSWMADELVPELRNFYSIWEKEFNTELIQDRHIIKPFTEEQEETLWLKKSQGAEPENVFLDSHIYKNLPVDEHYHVKKYSRVLQAGNLNVPHFLACTKKYLKEYYEFLEEAFDHDQLKITDLGISYKSLTGSNILFCEGHLISSNPYFNWIPMKPAKGETLTIYSEHIQLESDIFNKGFFILPLGNKLFKIGATYEWHTLNDIPTEEGKTELLKKLNAVVTTPYQIISHEAGVRPSVIDRRPVIGRHPEFANMYLFNGMGTKAVMLAPYFAKQLVESIRNNSKIDGEVDLSRFVV